ncbi:YicC/YloC family endoribonuclease [Litoreibacter albidus]|uniref:TIGR00255 family protein n=1 Tax=Litoreibacter albidus TaxID=670155 RepID=A0A1H2TIQ5_9RHOB|nr:YicC/YloC family endoribonuclease [Litoreibacter albidus]SDW43801.1 TIGR00255 family protein [Litoreibacter albidus]
MIRSMTAFASETGRAGDTSWVLEMRGVNAKGLDIRLRLPERLMPQEQLIRAKIAKAFARGNIGVTLRIEEGEASSPVRLDEHVLESYILAAIRVRTIAKNKGLKLSEATAPDYLGLRGVMRTDTELAPLPEAEIRQSIDAAIVGFDAMRASEGAALDAVMRDQLSQIADLTSAAAALAEARKDQVAETLKSNLARVMDNADGVDPNRVAQELALLAVKADVSEEIDRLLAHVAAAKALLDADGPVGRKLDFLMQEFNREANTLCSKSGDADLTRAGLDLKAVIDQMREQVQNVE